MHFISVTSCHNAKIKKDDRLTWDKGILMASEKEMQFERLWEGDTPSGKNETKALQFRQKMRMALLQKQAQYSKENAKLYWLGILHTERERISAEPSDFRREGNRGRVRR